MPLKLYGTEHNSLSHYPQEARAKVQTHIDIQVEVGAMREDQGTYPLRSQKASPRR